MQILCGQLNQSEGITRFKYHLTGANLKKCPNQVITKVPLKLQSEDKAKAKNNSIIEDLHQELYGDIHKECQSK